MKHNLKNRPSHKWMYENLDKIEVVDAWFEGFEKELCSRYNEVLKAHKNQKHPEIIANELNFIVKEIFGEV